MLHTNRVLAEARNYTAFYRCFFKDRHESSQDVGAARALRSLLAYAICFNLLNLPNIVDKTEMKQRLLASLKHVQGFTHV
uniref:HECT domain-containing protein n=1 Tax=Steinernema glaseri TaxID=37863 RepID=A0A1I7ZNE6_9BILA